MTILRAMVSAIVEAEMTAAPGAGKSERTPGRPGYQSGCYTRSRVTRVGQAPVVAPVGGHDCRDRAFPGKGGGLDVAACAHRAVQSACAPLRGH